MTTNLPLQHHDEVMQKGNLVIGTRFGVDDSIEAVQLEP